MLSGPEFHDGATPSYLSPGQLTNRTAPAHNHTSTTTTSTGSLTYSDAANPGLLSETNIFSLERPLPIQPTNPPNTLPPSPNHQTSTTSLT